MLKILLKIPLIFHIISFWTAFMSLKLSSSLPPALTLPLCNLSAFVMAQLRLTFPVNHILQDRCGISYINGMFSPKPDHREFSHHKAGLNLWSSLSVSVPTIGRQITSWAVTWIHTVLSVSAGFHWLVCHPPLMWRMIQPKRDSERWAHYVMKLP